MVLMVVPEKRVAQVEVARCAYELRVPALPLHVVLPAWAVSSSSLLTRVSVKRQDCRRLRHPNRRHNRRQRIRRRRQAGLNAA
jgi:hypothetical protein